MNIPNTTAGRRLIRRLTERGWDSSVQGTRNLGINALKREGDGIAWNNKDRRYHRTITRRILARQATN